MHVAIGRPKALFSLVLLVAVGSCRLVSAADRLAVPEASKVQAATSLLREAYAEQYAAAARDKDARSLITVLRDGSRASGDASLHYAQLQEAIRLAVEAELYVIADEVLSQKSQVFEAETLAERVLVLRKLATSKEAAQDPASFELACDIAEDSLAAESLEDAAAASRVATAIAKNIASAERRDATLRKRQRQQELTEPTRVGEAYAERAEGLKASVKVASEGMEDYKAALDVLANSPADASANFAVGRYRCFALGQWDAALPYLAKGGTDGLAALAGDEMRLGGEDGVEPEQLFDVAGRWWDLGEESANKADEARAIRRHASDLYAKSFPNLTDPIKKALAVKRAGATINRGEEGQLNTGGLAALAMAADKPAQPLPFAQRLRVGEVSVFLSDLPERDAHVGWGEFGKNGELGHFGRKVKVNGQLSPKGLSLAGVANGEARVTYDVPNKARLLVAGVAISDDAVNSGKGGSATPLTFRVLGPNGQVLWQTQAPLQQAGELRPCVVDVSKVQAVTLSVLCPGSHDHAMAVWIEPYFIARPAR
jgi:hypothetical protein